MMKRRINMFLIAAIAFIAFGGAVARADGMLIPGPWPPPRPIIEIEPMFHIKYHRVNVAINDQTVKTSVDQVFKSESRNEMEATYLFPLPEEAAINEFSMDVDGHDVKGRLLDKDEARRIYEGIVRHRKDPALLEYVGRGMFRASVYPIPAHGEKRISISYNELARARGEQTYRYVYPLSTEKFSTQNIDSVSVHVVIKTTNPLKNIYSPSHAISIRWHGNKEAEVSYEISNARPDRDFELYYSVSRDDVGITLLTDYSAADGGFFLLLASPNVDTGKNADPKDVIFVLDRTGSMSGDKISQARDALKFCLRSLNAKDRFNVIPFNEAPDPMFKSLESASSENINRAVDNVGSIDALGGTNIDEALRAALKFKSGSDRPTYILFLTDGLPTVGVTDYETILKTARDGSNKNTRLFVFGVGYDVNAHLLDKLSSQNHGTSEYVKPNEDIEVKVSDMFRMISSPALTEVAIDFGKMGAFDIVPTQYPDLFKGTQLIVAGRFRHTGRTTVKMTGTASGRDREFTLEQKIGDDDRSSFIPSLWASRRIGVLLDEIRLHGQNKELVDEVVRLSKRYGIITEYTSFLVEEPETRVLSAPAAEAALSARVSDNVVAASKNESGSWAVNQSVNNSKMKFSAAPMTQVQTYFDREGKTVEINNVQNISGLAFFNDKGQWTDSRYNEDITIIKIKPYSDAQFALIKAIPELAPLFAQGDRVLIVIGKTAILTDPKGDEKLSDDQIEQFKKDKAKLL
ncbi:MAG: VIT domain-containing protein [bacterium]